MIKYILIGIFSGVLNGLFGSGGGSLVVPSIEKFCGFESKKAHATAIAVILLMSLVSGSLYIAKGFFDIKLCLLSLVGGVGGGVMGAIFLNKIKVKLLKIAFGVIIMATAIKMILC